MLDSGATASVFGSKGLGILKQFDLQIHPASLRNISTADGSPQVVVDLSIVIENICQIITALVVPSSPQSFILGCDFAKQFQLSVNFKNNS